MVFVLVDVYYGKCNFLQEYIGKNILKVMILIFEIIIMKDCNRDMYDKKLYL